MSHIFHFPLVVQVFFYKNSNFPEFSLRFWQFFTFPEFSRFVATLYTFVYLIIFFDCDASNLQELENCMIQIPQELEPVSLKIKGTGGVASWIIIDINAIPATTFEFSEIWYLPKTITNVAAVVYRILDQRRLFWNTLRKIRNALLNFSFVCQNNLRWSKTRQTTLHHWLLLYQAVVLEKQRKSER